MRLVKLQEVQCMECAKDVIMAVQIGTVMVCIPCLEKVVDLVESKPELPKPKRTIKHTGKDTGKGGRVSIVEGVVTGVDYTN